ncbi:phage virion morphogenesis protein [Chitiniphilus eburneus]|uniref:phage virion morphogenesis protein n=1 Tax=Chitiniphilus eburneus TaxID=2571148 RepID=UPI0035D0BD96
MAELSTLSEFADGLLAQLRPAARRALARRIARQLRASQQQRIAAQQTPDGSPYAPRRPQRWRPGKIRRQMFAKLRTARWLKLRATDSAAIVEFADQVQGMARVHQFGLRDRVSRRLGALDAQYPMRELLGLSADDIAAIRDLVLRHLT